MREDNEDIPTDVVSQSFMMLDGFLLQLNTKASSMTSSTMFTYLSYAFNGQIHHII